MVKGAKVFDHIRLEGGDATIRGLASITGKFCFRRSMRLKQVEEEMKGAITKMIIILLV